MIRIEIESPSTRLVTAETRSDDMQAAVAVAAELLDGLPVHQVVRVTVEFKAGDSDPA